MGIMLERDALLMKQELEIEKVTFIGGDYVYVRQMTAKEKEQFEKSLMREVRDSNGEITKYEDNLEDFRAKLAEKTVCAADGRLLLQPGDYKILSENMSAARMECIIDAAQNLNAITKKDRDILVKKSKGDLGADSNFA